MSKTRISDEWLVGATLGAYAVLTFVLYFWGSAFLHFWCANGYESIFTSDGRAPGSLALLIPGVIVSVMNLGQVKLARRGTLGERAMRAALWMNLVGISTVLVANASNYGPAMTIHSRFLSLLEMAFWPLGLVISLRNLVWSGVHWVRAPRSEAFSSR